MSEQDGQWHYGMNVIIARHAQEATAFAREKKWSRKQYMICNEPQQLCGLERFTVWLLPYYDDRDDIEQMMDVLRTRQWVVYGRI